MRIVSFPSSLNAETGLICSHIGDRKDLELQTIENILVKAQPFQELYGYPEPSKEAVKRHA